MCDFIKNLRDKEDFIQLGGVSKSTITQAEGALGLEFSKEYRNYLIECGIARADGHEFTGIGNTERLSVVRVTREERESNPNVPNELYVIEDFGMDRIMIWQDQSGSVYQTVANGKPKIIAESICDYLVAK